jgi:DNA-binding transcriptional regulator LsrR (DeoR family)
MARKPIYSNLDWMQAMQYYKQGATQKEIAKKMGISQTTISKWYRGLFQKTLQKSSL